MTTVSQQPGNFGWAYLDPGKVSDAIRGCRGRDASGRAFLDTLPFELMVADAHVVKAEVAQDVLSPLNHAEFFLRLLHAAGGG